MSTPSAARHSRPIAVDPRYHVETAARTLELLRVVADLGTPASLGMLVSELGWSKPSVYRLVRTLETIGALRQSDGKGYVLGPALITLGLAALRATDVPEVATPHMERLFEQVGRETIVLTVLDGAEVVYVARIESDSLIIPRRRLGSRLPAYCTSTGQVLLAALDEDEVRRRMVGVELVKHGPNTLTSLDALLVRLREVERRGFALNNGELAVGHRAIAAPVRDHEDAVVAALSISVPAARVSLQELGRFARDELRETVRAISADLGSPTALAAA